MRFASTVLTLLAAIFCGPLSAEEYHTFRPKSGQSPIEAKLVAYDFETQTVTLSQQDGNQVRITIGDFNDTDKKWIVRSLEKQFFRRSTKPTASAIPGDKQSSQPRANNAAGFRGVPWQSSFADAAQLAKGSDLADDDKPILWFRVLGDLRGLM